MRALYDLSNEADEKGLRDGGACRWRRKHREQPVSTPTSLDNFDFKRVEFGGNLLAL